MAEDTQQQNKLLWSLHHMLWYTELLYATKDFFYSFNITFCKKKKNLRFYKGYSQFNEVCTVSEAMAAAALSVDNL